MVLEKAKKVLSLLKEGKIIEGTNGVFYIEGTHLTKKDVDTLNRAGILKRLPCEAKYSVKLGISVKGATTTFEV